MGKVVATVQLLTDEGKVAVDHTLQLEAYDLSARRWKTVATAETDAQGNTTLTTDITIVSNGLAPSLRLTEKGDPAPRVLAHGGLTRYTPNQETLFIDFGKIERLEETAHRLQHSASRFARTNESVAGVPAAPVVSSLAVNRMVNANPMLAPTVSLAGTFGAGTEPQIATPRIALDSQAIANIGFNTQLEGFKVREANLNSQLMDKNREVLNLNEELTQTRNNLEALIAERDALQFAAGLSEWEANPQTPREETMERYANTVGAVASGNTNLSVMVADWARREVELNNQLTDKNREIIIKNEQLKKMRNDFEILNVERNSLQDALVEAKSEKQSLSERIEELTANTRQAQPIEKVFSGIASQVNIAEETIKQSNIPYKLGNIKVDMRGSLLDEGTKIVVGEGDGGITTELINKTVDSGEVDATVPDIVGLTENAARRVLRSVGLRMKAAYKNVNESDSKETPGQALSQHPTAESQVASGSSVLVVFGA